MPTNPNSPAQGAVRSTFGYLASTWNLYGEGTQNAWLECAKRFPKTDSLGQTIVLSGFQQFMRSNTAFLFVGQAVLNTPPADTPWGTNVIVPTVVAGPVKKFEFAYTPPPDGQFLIVDCSPQVSAGINFWSQWKNLAIQGHAGPSPAEELAKYQLLFGSLIPDQKIFFRSRVLNECGVYGPEAIVSTLITGTATVTLTGARSGKTKEKGKQAQADA